LSGDQRTNVKSFLGKKNYTWFDCKESYGKGLSFSHLMNAVFFHSCSRSRNLSRWYHRVARFLNQSREEIMV
jgi:hypothetical protein